MAMKVKMDSEESEGEAEDKIDQMFKEKMIDKEDNKDSENEKVEDKEEEKEMDNGKLEIQVK